MLHQKTIRPAVMVDARRLDVALVRSDLQQTTLMAASTAIHQHTEPVSRLVAGLQAGPAVELAGSVAKFANPLLKTNQQDGRSTVPV